MAYHMGLDASTSPKGDIFSYVRVNDEKLLRQILKFLKNIDNMSFYPQIGISVG